MKLEKINNILSDEFKNAVKLGDDNAKTLGFLPYVAFEKYAKQNQLIGAFDKTNSELLGYLLYRTSYDKVTIVHLCIDEKHRSKSVAKNLVDYLKKNTKKHQGIRLSCRNDYGINKVWERFNFVPLFEKPGRSKAGLPLTIWWFPHSHTNLFSQIADYEKNNKISVVIDMNIFLDIKDKRNKESLALQSDWLLNEINLYLSREIFNEINRNSDSDIKASSRSFASYFKELSFSENEFLDTYSELLQIFNPKSENDKSDLKHIAYAISSEADYFLTRDEFILQNEGKFTEYGITVFRPSEFITHLDESLQTSKYKPQKLIGTNISSTNITAKNVDSLITSFLTSHERKGVLNEKVRTYLSFPQKYELITISKESELIAFVVFDRSETNKLIIPIFRFLKNKLKETLTKHLLFKIIFTANNENRMFIEISENQLDIETENIINETRFIKSYDIWQKINFRGILSKELTNQKLENLITENINEFLNTADLSLSVNPHERELLVDYNLERFLFPLKIEDLELPNFIVPIKPHWAEALFDDKSKQKLSFYEPNYTLLLNRENVYYRSATPKILKSPARILWYVSENKHTKQKGHIRACSYIDAIFLDKPKKLFKRFEQLGIYQWKQIAETAGNKQEIMAFIFSDTELFNRNVEMSYINDIFDRVENKKFMVVSPIEIKKETYIDLYKKGMQL